MKISEIVDSLETILKSKDNNIKKEFKIIIYNQDICFNDYYENFGKKLFSSDNHSLLLNNTDLITSELFEESAILYFKDKKNKIIDFLLVFMEKINEGYGFYKKFFKNILNILNLFLKNKWLESNYKIIELINELYFIQKKYDKKIKKDFLSFYKEHFRCFDYIKDDSFNIVSKEEITASNPFKLFYLINLGFNNIYDDSLQLRNLDLNDFDKNNINEKCRYSSFQEHKEPQLKRMYFFALSKEIADNFKISISNFHNHNQNIQYADILLNITLPSIEKYYIDILKKEKIYNFNEKKEILMDDQLALVLKNYLFHASYSFFCLNLPSVSILYIYLFLHAINIHITGKENNNIEEGLSFLLKHSKKRFENDKNIFLSFLTKEKFGFDLRTGILHSTGFDMPSVEIFCLYFFSFLHNNFYVDPVYSLDNKDYNKYIFNYKDLLSNIDIESHGEQKNYISNESYENFLMNSNHQMSLFFINFISLEEFLFVESDSPFLCNKKNDYLIFFLGFNSLKVEFMKTKIYKKYKDDFDEVFSLLYFEYKGKKENIRNCIFHYSTDNFFNLEYQNTLKKFNQKFKEIKAKIGEK